MIVRTTISLPNPVLENAREFANKRGITLSALIQDALIAQMSQSESPAPSEFRLFTVKGKLADPNLDLDKTSALIVADDKEEYGGRL